MELAAELHGRVLRGGRPALESGSVREEEVRAVAEAARTCPGMLGTLQSIWVGADPVYWLLQADGSYRPAPVTEGCVQGGCKAAVPAIL